MGTLPASRSPSWVQDYHTMTTLSRTFKTGLRGQEHLPASLVSRWGAPPGRRVCSFVDTCKRRAWGRMSQRCYQTVTGEGRTIHCSIMRQFASRVFKYAHSHDHVYNFVQSRSRAVAKRYSCASRVPGTSQNGKTGALASTTDHTTISTPTQTSQTPNAANPHRYKVNSLKVPIP